MEEHGKKLHIRAEQLQNWHGKLRPKHRRPKHFACVSFNKPRCWRANIFVGGPMIYEGLWCRYVKLIYSMCSTWNQCNSRHHERYVGNLKGIYSQWVFAYVLHQFVWELGSINLTIWPPNPYALQELSHVSYTRSRKNLTNLISTSESPCGLGLWGFSISFPFWVSGGFLLTLQLAGQVEPQLEARWILSNWMQLENWENWKILGDL